MHLHKYLDCRWSFVLTGFIDTVEYEDLGGQNTPNDIQFASRRAIKDKLWDDTAGTPKGMCPGFTLNVKCAHVIGNLSSHCLCGVPG